MAKVTATMPVRLPPARSWMMAFSGRPRPVATDCPLDIADLPKLGADGAWIGERRTLLCYPPGYPAPLQPILAPPAGQCRVPDTAGRSRLPWPGGLVLMAARPERREEEHGLRDDRGAAARRRARRRDQRRRPRRDRRQPH